ncbi:MAG: hypothetical protein IJ557_02465 [Bacteroidaceae bacterium]|nr:hypothetical protein [Bacteroidaceae bacterium]
MAETTESKEHVQQAKPCPHDCRKCMIQQQIYCTTQMTYNASEQISRLQEKIVEMEKHFAALSKVINSIQMVEANLASPMQDLFGTESTE